MSKEDGGGDAELGIDWEGLEKKKSSFDVWWFSIMMLWANKTATTDAYKEAEMFAESFVRIFTLKMRKGPYLKEKSSFKFYFVLWKRNKIVRILNSTCHLQKVAKICNKNG